MSEMAETVAKAIWGAKFGYLRRWGSQVPLVAWEDAGHKRQDACRAEARAAITAMREITEDMVQAGIAADDKRTGNQTIRHIHRAMISAALADGEPQN